MSNIQNKPHVLALLAFAQLIIALVDAVSN
jgi:hypothetical protein